MTSGTTAALNASHHNLAAAEVVDQVRSSAKHLSKLEQNHTDSASASAPAVNGASNGVGHDESNGLDGRHDAEESEAETEILQGSDVEHDAQLDKTKRKAVKVELMDDETNNHNRARHTTSSRAQNRNGDVVARRNGSSVSGEGDRHTRRNGQMNGEGTTVKPSLNGDKSSGKPHLNSIDTDTRASSTSTPASPITSPPGHARVGGARKRKISEEHHLNNLEHPRQRVKSEHSAKSHASNAHNSRTQPTSPTVTSPTLRSHRRSASTQSVQPVAQSRRRREQSSGNDNKSWTSETSSNASSSPQPYSATFVGTTSRTRRSAQRSALSPARSVAMPAVKKNYDRFGATRLARECTRNPANMEAVVAAFDDHPEELDQKDFAGYAPVQKAALAGNAKVVKYLISKGCKLQTHADNGDTPLIDATENGHVDIVRMLLAKGVNPHHANHAGARAIDTIDRDSEGSDKKAFDEIEAMLQKAMREHANEGNESDTAQPVSSRDDIKKPDRQDLLYLESNISNLRKFSSLGDIQAVDQFLMGGVAPDNQCMINAARAGHQDVLNLLIANQSFKGERDPDPAKHGDETPLIAAIGRGHIGIIAILIAQDCFNPSRRTTKGETYSELAELRRGPKWQQEQELLDAKLEEWRSKRKAEKRRRLEGSSAEKSEKPHKVGSGESPRLKKRLQRTSSPTRQLDRKTSAEKLARAKLKQERAEGSTAVPRKSLDGGKDRKVVKDGTSQIKMRRKQIVDDESDSESDSASASHPATRIKAPPINDKKTPATIKARKLSSVGKKPSTESMKARHAAKAVDIVDEDMTDAPQAADKEHTPDPVRLRRISESEQDTDRRRLDVERQRLAEEQQTAERKRSEWLGRIDGYPVGLHHACIRGKNLPLMALGAEWGIGMMFMPIRTIRLSEIDPDCPKERTGEMYMPSFQAVGILGLPELDLAASAVSRDWVTLPMTSDLRTRFLKKYDIAQLAFCEEPTGRLDYQRECTDGGWQWREASEKFANMQPLSWVRYADFEQAFGEQERLQQVKVRTKEIFLRDPPESLQALSFTDWIKQAKGTKVMPASQIRYQPSPWATAKEEGLEVGPAPVIEMDRSEDNDAMDLS